MEKYDEYSSKTNDLKTISEFMQQFDSDEHIYAETKTLLKDAIQYNQLEDLEKQRDNQKEMLEEKKVQNKVSENNITRELVLSRSKSGYINIAILITMIVSISFIVAFITYSLISK